MPPSGDDIHIRICVVQLSTRYNCPCIIISVISLSDCVPAVEPSDGSGCHGSGKLALPLPKGFLLGPVRSTGLGSSPASCIYVISAAEGQRINLTLYDFGAYASQSVCLCQYITLLNTSSSSSSSSSSLSSSYCFNRTMTHRIEHNKSKVHAVKTVNE